MATLLRISIFVSLLLIATTAAWGVDYKVVILNPPGSFLNEAYGISGGQQVGHGMTSDSSTEDHALLWSGSAQSVVDLHPIGFDYSVGYSISGGQQAGYGFNTATQEQHALLWSGTAHSVVDLHPAGFSYSQAWGASGGKQVGYGRNIAEDTEHALLWSGTASSVIDLHDYAFEGTIAYDIADNQQVGFGGNKVGYGAHRALLWYGTSGSVVNLHPSGFTYSKAYGVGDGQQVGSAYNATTDSSHALLWTGSAGSFVDLNPRGFSNAVAYDAAGGRQVGAGSGPEHLAHALVWSGTSDSAVDLHSYLSDGYDESVAWGIDPTGVIVGATWMWSPTGQFHAVMWVPLIYVEIDIKPGSYPNSINLGNEGVIPVAILSSWEFDATTVDPATVELAGAGVELRGKSDKAMAHEEDVNKDGLIDLVVQITTQNLDPGTFQDGYATLTGRTYDGTAIEGSDEINIVPK